MPRGGAQARVLAPYAACSTLSYTLSPYTASQHFLTPFHPTQLAQHFLTPLHPTQLAQHFLTPFHTTQLAQLPNRPHPYHKSTHCKLIARQSTTNLPYVRTPPNASADESLVSLFLEAGANVLASDGIGATALISAAYRGHAKVGILFASVLCCLPTSVSVSAL